MNNRKVACFFAGAGGIDLGFEQTGAFEVVYANEIDKDPIATYENNFNIRADCRDINTINASEMPESDVMVGGFPCQAFSLAGYRQRFDDEKGRGTLFFEMMRIISEKKAAGHQPKVVFFENVKNLVGHDHGNTFQVIQEQLEYLGYHIKIKVLNAMEYGNVPQNRLSPKARQYFQAMTAS